MSGEEWRVIADFPEYIVSSFGRVKRIGSPKDRALKPLIRRRGYVYVNVRDHGRPSCRRVNRLVCEAFHGKPPTDKHHAAHNDGVASNNNRENLRWATLAENEADKRKHGTIPAGDDHWSRRNPDKTTKGSASGMAKLIEENIRSIRLDNRYPHVIAAEYGVSDATIRSIKQRKTWGHVE